MHQLVYLRSPDEPLAQSVHGSSVCREQVIQDVRRGDEDKVDIRPINTLSLVLYFEIGIRSLLLSSLHYLLVGYGEEVLWHF